MLGTDLGTAHHPMDLSVDIPDLMESLSDNEVYIFKNGRHLDDDDEPVVDIISSGLADLLSGKASPLSDYNKAFTQLQARRMLIPLFGGPLVLPSEPQSTSQAPGTPSTIAAPAPLLLPVLTQILKPEDILNAASEADSSDEEGSGSEELDNAGDGCSSESGESEVESEIDPEELGDFLASFEQVRDDPYSLRLDSAADVSLDMDSEDLGLKDTSPESDNEATSDESDDNEAGSVDYDSDSIFL